MAGSTTASIVANIEIQVPLISDISKVMAAFIHAPDTLKKLVPDVYKSVEIKNTGNLRDIEIEIEYADGVIIKKEIDRLDDLNLKEVKASYTVVGGDYAEKYKSYEGTLQFAKNNKVGTLAIRTYKVEYKEGSPDIMEFVNFDIETLHKIDDALRKITNSPQGGK